MMQRLVLKKLGVMSFVIAGLALSFSVVVWANNPQVSVQDLIEQDATEAGSVDDWHWAPNLHQGEVPSFFSEDDLEGEEAQAQQGPSEAELHEPVAELEEGTDLPAKVQDALQDTQPGNVEDSAANMAPSESLPEPSKDAALAGDADAHDPLPSSPLLDKQKSFWVHVFTKINFNQGIVHDAREDLPIYGMMNLDGVPYRKQWRLVRAELSRVRKALWKLADARESGAPIPEAHAALAEKLPADWDAKEIRASASNLRFQRGLAKRFREGIIRSGRYMEEMRGLMIKHRVPEDLVYLPMVESTYYNRTISKVGAAGVWQFTRATGNYYMKINRDMDQRFDPLVAAEAAAKFLRQNRDQLGTWPLAITGYNHGPNSIARITKKLNTKDLSTIIKTYKGPYFGVASRNFYSSFLAAREVVQNYKKYFGPLELEKPMRYKTVKLPYYLHVDDALKAAGVKKDFLRGLNPGLRSSIWAGVRYIPKGHTIRIPVSMEGEAFLAAVPEVRQKNSQTQELIVVVDYGDSLYKIGRRYGVQWPLIAEANNIYGSHKIRPGQKLIIPLSSKAPSLQAKKKNTMAAAASAAGANSAGRIAAVKALAAKATSVLPGEKPSDSDPAEKMASNVVVAGPLDNAARFQKMELTEYDASSKVGQIIAAFGETLGLYAEWSKVTIPTLQAVNQRYGVSRLQMGYAFSIPMSKVSKESFVNARKAFHRQREASFLSENHITEVVEVKVKRGQSPWKLAQSNRIPMWLFYRENPKLIRGAMHAGMKVSLPVIQEISTNDSQVLEVR